MKRAHWNQKKTTYITAGAISVVGCFLMVAFPDIAVNGCRFGLNLFAGTVLPTLFPFFVAVNFMIRLHLPERVGRILEPLIQRVYGCSGIGAFIWMVSLCSGYPMAAKLVGDYCRMGRISVEEGKRILSFSCVSGPLFIVGTVGAAMLGNTGFGYLIALGHYGAALLNGLLFCRVLLPAQPIRRPVMGRREEGASSLREMAAGSMSEHLSAAIYSSFRSLMQICGYIVLFSIASEFLQCSGLLSLCPVPWGGAVIKGILEMTMGCDAAAKLMGVSGVFQLSLCAFILSFGGLSIAGQSLSMLADSRIGAAYYIPMKLCHGCLAAFLTTAAALAARQLGWMDMTAALVYGSDQKAVALLGGIYSLLFSARSIAVIFLLMAGLLLLDGILQKFKLRMQKIFIDHKRNML